MLLTRSSIGEGSVSPPRSPFGKHEVDMTAEGVLQFVCHFQREAKLRQPDMIHDDEELALALHSRQKAEEVMVEVFKKRRVAFCKEDPRSDRTNFPMVVCSGMKGLGKTRMLEEWQRLFGMAKIPEPHLGVFVAYGNGHSPKVFESAMPIEAAFGWRMLHRLFVEDNTDEEEAIHWHQRGFLPNNAYDLALDSALQVIRKGAQRFGLVKEGQTLSLFIGIDEYQNIPTGPNFDSKAEDQKREREKTFLWQLIAAFDGCRGIQGLHFYLGFAGTRWGPLSIAGSSVPGTRRAPLLLLHPQSMEDVIRSSESMAEKLADPDFRRKLFFLGGVPRPCVKYALGKESFESVWSEYVVEKWMHATDGLSIKEVLRMIAFAVSGITTSTGEASEIKGLTWGRLFEEGLCLPLNDGQLGIPYCLFRLASIFDSDLPHLSLPEKCLLQNLRYLYKHVDRVLFDNEPWQLWEKFSACFFSMHVNARLLLGVTSCSFSKLCKHAAVSGCKMQVHLRPMEVHAIEESLSPGLPVVVTTKKNRRRLNWLEGNEGVGYCLLNGTSGFGVDVFAALPLADGSGGFCLYNAQQKVEASSLGSVSAKKLLGKADVRPLCLPAGSVCVRGLFSILASYNQNAEALPMDTFVLSYRQHDAFHGALSVHPACKTWVDVNFDNVSTVRLLKSVARIADAILEKRASAGKFVSVAAFKAFCDEKKCPLAQEDEVRVVAEANV